MYTPTTIEELQDVVRSNNRVLAVGGRTKTRLSAVSDCEIVRMTSLTGITEYEPSEYTFTARAGTSMKEIHEAVNAKGQFLPCSALLRESGATLGGAIASGLSGPGRFRFGGMRDFLLGIQYVSGDGKLISAGGKVVKNAAGFDLPKFMVGSLGRYGILTEVSFKVFPRPSSLKTVVVQCASNEQAFERMVYAASSRWELYAIDYGGDSKQLFLRIGGPVAGVEAISSEIQSTWQGEVSELSDAENEQFWDGIREVRWAEDAGAPMAAAIKVPISPKQMVPLQKSLDALPQVKSHYSVGGNVVGIAVADVDSLEHVDALLATMGLRGMVFMGGAECPLWVGAKTAMAIDSAMKSALDPCAKFPTIH